jgi:hypothetical protein
MDRPSRGAWSDMIQRCQNPNHKDYERYGGRGITVCPEWHRYQVFSDWIFENLGPRPQGWSLDRWPDNDGPYKPGNVRWADPIMQRANRSDSMASADSESDRLIKAFLAMPVPYPSALHFTRRRAWG